MTSHISTSEIFPVSFGELNYCETLVSLHLEAPQCNFG